MPKIYWTQDPYYSSVRPHYSDAELTAAGFFPEAQPTLDLHLPWLTTPVHKIIKNYPRDPAARPVVLITTGAFSPLHPGHLAALERAREHLTGQGRVVVGGYISPSHDLYVNQKYQGQAAKPIAERILAAEHMVAESSWLMVDGFEGQICAYPINFTSVILRLQAYLNYHLPEHPVDLVYVFGSDNAAFMRTFAFLGEAVCIERAGFPLATQPADPLLLHNRRCHFIAHHQSDLAAASSTHIRAQTAPPAAPLTGWYFLRDDREFMAHSNPIDFTTILDWLQNQLPPLIPGRLHLIPLRAQIEKIPPISDNLWSLDPCLPLPQQLPLTRLFHIADGQVISHHLRLRPEVTHWPRPQHSEIDVIDDDISTGATKRLITQLLAPIKINRYHTALEIYKQTQGLTEPTLDIIDLRDFCLGAPFSGLTCQLPNQTIARVPYVWPYVRLSTRAKIKPTAELTFSLGLWELWGQIYQSLPKHTLQDLPSSLHPLWHYLRWAPQTPTYEFCRHHAAWLKIILENQLKND